MNEKSSGKKSEEKQVSGSKKYEKLDNKLD